MDLIKVAGLFIYRVSLILQVRSLIEFTVESLFWKHLIQHRLQIHFAQGLFALDLF